MIPQLALIALMAALAPGGLVDGIPKRLAAAPAGTAFMNAIKDLPPVEREAAIAREITAGNIPAFLRGWKTIRVTAIDAAGGPHEAVFQVMPDYLCVGSDEDFVRMPMTPMAAQRIADRFDCLLPTRKMVNDIYVAATCKLEPRPLTVDREAVTTFLHHHRIIEEQRAGHPLGELVAGIKKDVVLTNLPQVNPGRVAIYGWHKLDGSPIQPLTTVHGETYVDYSHGIRLIKGSMVVDGKPMQVCDVLMHPLLNVLLSDEGPLRRVTY